MAISDNPAQKPPVAASFMFADGQRPSVEVIEHLAEGDGWFTVSFVPEQNVSEPAEHWVELLAHGLTFDLAGLSPGPSLAVPPKGHLFGFKNDAAPDSPEALTLSAGPHLSGGRRSLPIIRSLAGLAARLADLPGIRAVGWPSARIWCEPHHFRESVLAWLDGGAFPGFSLVALTMAPDGGMQSEGLALFTGQELRLEPPLMADRAEGARIALRLLHLLADHGPVVAPQVVKAPDGTPLRLVSSPNGLFVRVWGNDYQP